jgi:molybdopterin-guanine dinucleotide biosynthesis protein B
MGPDSPSGLTHVTHAPQPRLIGLAGWSGSGKTTLMTKLIPALTARGLSVSTIKHAHHAFDIDQPGKDSWLHRQAGATEVLVASSNRFALIHELRGAPEPSLDELVARLAPADIVLVEGFRHGAHPKIEICRPEAGKKPLHPDDPNIVAVASPEPIAGLALPWLPLNDAGAIADFILKR